MVRFHHLALALLLVAAPSSLRAQVADASAGARTFSTSCAACHGADGRGGERGPNIAAAREVVSLTDADLTAFIRNGVPGSGMPSFSFLGDRTIVDLVAHLRVLQGRTAQVHVTGDRSVGSTLFFGAGGCAACHTIEGRGGFIATDLSDYGATMPPDRIRAAILDPDGTVGLKAEALDVTTSTGETVHGVVRAEDTFILVLQLEDGRLRRLSKSALRSIRRSGHSLMPTDYGNRLSPKQVDDLVAYIVLTAREPLAATPQKPAGVKP
jgi:putative heme-binding domain-containing protein